MKKKLALLAGTLALSFSIGVYAENKVNLIINGKKIDTDIQIVNGSSYVPLRVVSENLGANVQWDANTKTITITSPGNAGTPAPPGSIGLSRNNPAPIGKAVTVSHKDFADEYTAAITLQEVVRGNEAWQRILQANQFNAEPAAGHEYILAKMKVHLSSNKDDAQLDIYSGSFTLVSSDGRDYPIKAVVEPEPQISTKLYPGATHEGWVAFEVKKDDLNPLITFGRDYQGKGGAWFKLSQ